MSRSMFKFAQMVVLLISVCASRQALAQVRWQSGTTTRSGQSRSEILDTLAACVQGDADRHVVVQFAGPLSPEDRATLKAGGVTPLTYLGDHAFFAAVSSEKLNRDSLSCVTSLVDVQAVQRDWKLHPDLAADVVHPWAVVEEDAEDPVVAAYVLFHADVDLDAVGVPLVLTYGAGIRSELRSINGLVIELSASMIKPLAEEDAVQWIEPPLPTLGHTNNVTRARMQADYVHARPYELDGSGVNVMVFDGGLIWSDHWDFEDRVTRCEATDSSPVHPTHVAGTIAGAGIADATYEGVAPGATLLSYELDVDLQPGFLYTDPGDIEADYADAIANYGAVIANNSIGSNVASNYFDCDWEGNYGATSQLIDTIVRGDGSNSLFAEPFRIIWANGNERGGLRCGETYHTTAPPACAKNHIAVGAIDGIDDSVSSFTSWGPTDDGRLKPDFCAPGVDVMSCSIALFDGQAYFAMSGTSMASPAVCGAGALLIEDYRNQFPDLPEMRNSTLKILLAHTAVDLVTPGPDYQTGYGSVRIQDAVDLLRSGRFLEAELDQGTEHEYFAYVEEGQSELKITLAWDDVPGAANTIPELVNDLDLQLFSPEGVRHFPWTLGGLDNPADPAVRTQEDHVNNIEQVVADSPQVGVWTITISPYDVPSGPQPYSLCGESLLTACTSTGALSLDHSIYQCSDVVELTLLDCDLNTDDSVVETTTVTVASDSEPSGETVVLTEIGLALGEFRGAIAVENGGGSGVLHVTDGDSITATYVDADDGQGNQNVTVTEVALTDCVAPAVSDVQVTIVSRTEALVTFHTSEFAASSIDYGLSCDALTEFTMGNLYETEHSVTLEGLNEDTTYYFEVHTQDIAGNAASDDNGGECYVFRMPLTNDNCENATWVCPGIYTGNTEDMSADGDVGDECFESNGTPDCWYRYMPQSSGSLELALCDSEYMAAISVHTGCPGTSDNSIVCADHAFPAPDPELECPDNTRPYVSVPVSVGQTYYIRIAGTFAEASDSSGDYVLEVSGPACTVVSGDIDADGDVDLSDLATLLAAYGTCSGDLQYSADADLDSDGCVDLSDLAALLGNYGYGG